MASVNKTILIGNIGKDPETRHMPNGDAVTNMTMATKESWTDKATGEKKELTEWHRVTFYRKLAEIAGKYLKKGASVYIEGRLQTRKWTDKDGVDRYTTEIIADSMQMLGSKQGSGNDGVPPMDDDQPSEGMPAKRTAKKTQSDQDDDDKIPF